MMQFLHAKTPAFAQAAALILIWFAANWLTSLRHMPIPAGVVGLFALLGLLATGILPSRSLEAGADLLLGEILLFFIPALVGAGRFQHLFAQYSWHLLGVLCLGWLIVTVGTGLVVDRIFRIEHRRLVKARAKPWTH